MSVVAEFTLPATDFELGRLLEVRQGIDVRLESMIPTGDSVMPYFWVSARDSEAVEAALERDELAESYEIVDTVNDEVLFRVEWSEDINGVVEALLDADAVVLQAVGTGDSWSLELRFGEYDSLSSFYRNCIEKDISLDLDRVYDAAESRGHGDYGLTPEQLQTLLNAFEAGYYDVPRETTLVELADQLGISDSAVSQRLRRGTAALISSTLLSDT